MTIDPQRFERLLSAFDLEQLFNELGVAVQRPLDRCLQPDQDVPPTLPDETAPLTDAPERPQPQPA